MRSRGATSLRCCRRAAASRSASSSRRCSPGLTLVVSPLIALMKDQVDALSASGIPATFLNSSLDADEARARLRGCYQGEYRLLYVAPERLMMPAVPRELAGVGLARSPWTRRIASPSGATISGRNTGRFRGCAALSRSRDGAHGDRDQRVREDIVRALGLREPRCYVRASTAQICSTA